MSLLLVLIAYIYQPQDWQNYPRMDHIQNFTADAFKTVYVVTDDAIIELDPQTNQPRRSYNSGDGLPRDLNLAIYDSHANMFWIVTTDGYLHRFIPNARMAIRLNTRPFSNIVRLGFDDSYIYLIGSDDTTAIGKLSRQIEDVSPSDDASWTGGFDASRMRQDYPFLHPWVLDDPSFPMLSFSQIFSHRNKAFVAVSGYGYLVYNELSWQEELKYQSPQAEEVYSIISADSSIYAFGRNGADQVVADGNQQVYREYFRWGTTLNPQPEWSKGIADRLRRINFDRVRLIEDNLFLIDNNEAIVFNTESKDVSELTSVDIIYDVDYRNDSLLVATDDGVFLTVISDSAAEPVSLRDERSKLFRSDVLAIIPGEHARYFWTGWQVVKQSGEGWEYFTSPGFMPVPQKDVTGRDSLVILGGNGGVTIYNPETYFQLNLTTQEGLLSDNVTAVQIVDDYLWIASDAGLQRFNLSAVLF